MSPFEKRFKKEYSRILLPIAESDFTAGTLMKPNAHLIRKEIIIFQFQQAVEKALKSVLCQLGRPVPMTHDLQVALVLLREIQPPHAEVLNELTPYATVKRYEEGVELLTIADIENAEKLARAVLDWAGKIIKGDERSV